ncbi:MAG: DUF3592 domain-containing protein [Ruminococcaceae bacterium]|nr:DUF3592 domain-containing protein [Oscillospiraceae bacterium]
MNGKKLILLGCAVFLVGCIQPSRYEFAKENGYEVEATVMKVVQKEEYDSDGPSSDSYILYGDYEVDGKTYKNVKLGKYYDTSNYGKGDTVKVVVDPKNPGKLMFEGGVVCVIGFLMTIVGIVKRVKEKKREKAADGPAPAENSEVQG